MEPTTVWMIRPGEDRGRRGTLLLEDGSPVFLVGRESRRLGPVRTVRRIRGSPVLRVVYGQNGEQREVFLYFVEPIPVRRPSPLRLPRIGGGSPSRLRALRMLREANRRLKPEVERWERAIREATG